MLNYDNIMPIIHNNMPALIALVGNETHVQYNDNEGYSIIHISWISMNMVIVSDYNGDLSCKEHRFTAHNWSGDWDLRYAHFLDNVIKVFSEVFNAKFSLDVINFIVHSEPFKYLKNKASGNGSHAIYTKMRAKLAKQIKEEEEI